MAVWIRPVFALEHLSPLYTCGCYRTSHSAVRVPRGDRGNDDVVRATVLLVCYGDSKKAVLDSSHSTELLNTSPTIGPDMQYYTVRRISSFGRVPSQEDVDGSSLDLTAVFISEEGTKEHEFDITEKLTDCIQTKQFEKCTSESHPHQGKKKGRWRKALHTLKPKSSKIDLKTIVPPSTDLATMTSIVIPPITLSSPSLLQDLKEPLSGLQLRHVSTVLDMNSLNQPVVRWMKSQSMQDINHSLEQETSKASSATLLARSVGLDTSLYTTVMPLPYYASMERVNIKRPSQNLQELSYGQINFNATYSEHKKKLFVHVKQLEGLPVEGEVLLKLTVLPLGKVIKTARAEPPRVNEHLHLTVTEPARKVLRLSVYPARSQGKYGAIGHALLGLEEVLARKSEDFSMKLYRNAEPDINPGSIQLSLEYDMEHQRLTLRVKKASNLMIRHLLKSHKHTDKFNTYVKAALFKEDQKLRSKKSSVVGNERDPCYDQEFLFKIPQKHLADSSVVVSIMLKELLRKDIAIGRVILGPYMYAEGHTLTPWGQVMEKSQCVEHWFRLYL